jgi:hypothetical protein
VSLPLYPGLTPAEITRVASAIRDIVSAARAVLLAPMASYV